jgi:hypothetical protein
MDSPLSRDAELLPVPVPVPSLPASNLSQSASTPHYIIAAREITADRDSPLGSNRRTGSVFKGSWNNSVVAVKVLSNETPVDVG